MYRDRYGLPLSAASETAAAAYREGVDLLLSAWSGAAEVLDRAIADDPGFALAYIARARLHHIHAEVADACAKATQARTLAEGLSQRERQHVEIIASAIEGKAGPALAAAEQHLDEFPRDALVLSLLLGAFGLYAFSGRVDHDAAKVAICERLARHYGEDWWLLAFQGWSHTEAGNVPHGRRLTERALTLRCQNGNAAHALSHALFEQGDPVAGSAFLAEWLPGYDRAGFLNGHLSWHLALAALDVGDPERALSIYRERICPDVSRAPPLAVFTDSVSLLWRLALLGQRNLEPYWREIAAYGDKKFPTGGVHFADVHWAMAASAIKGEGFDRRLADLAALELKGRLAPGPSAIGLCQGVRAFAEADYETAITVLEPCMAELTRIGGSHAQREVYEDTLIIACLRGGHPEKAQELLHHRLQHRPSGRDQIWLQQATPSSVLTQGIAAQVLADSPDL
jgi:tetratricopeptide (TPR) repeat protein